MKPVARISRRRGAGANDELAAAAGVVERLVAELHQSIDHANTFVASTPALAGTATAIAGFHVAVLLPTPAVPVTTGAAEWASVMGVPVAVMVPVVVIVPGV